MIILNERERRIGQRAEKYPFPLFCADFSMLAIKQIY